ncbi:MAG: AMP-binding protein [Elainellaceae cyanobacterium]
MPDSKIVQPARITDGLIASATQHPEAIALTIGTSQDPLHCTYGEMLSSVRAIAAQVSELSPNENINRRALPQQPWVALLLPNRAELLTYFFGTALADGVAMVLNPDWSQAQITTLLQRWTPDLLVTEIPILEGLKQSGAWAAIHAIQPVKAIALPPVNDCGAIRATPRQANAPNLPNLPHPNLLTPDSFPPPSSPPPSSLPFYIGFTSGTTGQPKGVIRSHQSWINSFRISRQVFGFAPDESILVPGSLVHSLSLYTALEALVQGATLHLLPSFHPKHALHRLSSEPITRLVAVPTLLGAIARAMQRRALSCPTVRSIISAGSKLSPKLRHQLQKGFPNAEVLEYYGASELSFISLASSQDSVPLHSVGRPFPEVTVGIRRPTGEPAPPGEIGQISIQSAMICSGYLDPTDDTGFRIEQGWATVGDRGWLDDQGFLYLAGRERDMVICNGVNVYPAEVEAALVTHPAIEEAIVLGLPDDCRGDRLYAVLTLSDGEVLNRADVTRHLQMCLEPAKCPRQWFVTEALPLTSSGKIDRATLLRNVLSGHPSLQKLGLHSME